MKNCSFLVILVGFCEICAGQGGIQIPITTYTYKESPKSFCAITEVHMSSISQSLPVVLHIEKHTDPFHLYDMNLLVPSSSSVLEKSNYLVPSYTHESDNVGKFGWGGFNRSYTGII